MGCPCAGSGLQAGGGATMGSGAPMGSGVAPMGNGVAGGLPSTGAVPPHIQVGGRSRRRKNTRRHRRSGTRKTRSCGRKRACKCPGGCKRSTCPCCTGKRFCCTKRCRGRGCRC